MTWILFFTHADQVGARDLRPCTLMMVQKLHMNGQPRPARFELLDELRRPR
jgi:hypothetical protein